MSGRPVPANNMTAMCKNIIARTKNMTFGFCCVAPAPSRLDCQKE